jgi:hypothetical protein
MTTPDFGAGKTTARSPAGKTKIFFRESFFREIKTIQAEDRCCKQTLAIFYWQYFIGIYLKINDQVVRGY